MRKYWLYASFIAFLCCLGFLVYTYNSREVHGDEVIEEVSMSPSLTLVEAEALYNKAQQLEYRAQLDDPLIFSERQEIYRLYKQAYDAGYKRATGDLGMVTILGYNKDEVRAQLDIEEARRLFEEGMQRDDTRAIRGMALMYRQGIGVKRDLKQAVELYEKAAGLGDYQAMTLWAMFLTGQTYDLYSHLPPSSWPPPFKETDHNLGLRLLQQAGENGNLMAWKILADYYDYEAKDPKMEEYYLREGAKRGNAESLLNLYLRYGQDNPYYPFAEDLTREDKDRLKKCTWQLRIKSDRTKDTPIPNLDELCPRKLPQSAP